MKDKKMRKATLQELLQSLRTQGALQGLVSAPANLISMLQRLISLLEDIDDRGQEWHLLLRESWRLLSLAVDSSHVSEPNSLRVLKQVVQDRMCPRLGSLACYSANTVIGAKYSALDEVAMSIHRSLLCVGSTDAKSMAFHVLNSASLRQSFRLLITNCGRAYSHSNPAQSIASIGSAAQWLEEVCRDSNCMSAMNIDHLLWILGVQVDTLKLQMQMIESSFAGQDDGDGAMICSTHWAAPQLLFTAQQVMQKMTTGAVEPNAKALDLVLAVLPQALSLCHQVLFRCESARTLDPTAVSGVLHPSHPVAKNDNTALTNISTVVQLGLQCLACAASAGRISPFKLSQRTITHLLLLLARSARLAHTPDEQFQQLLNMAGLLNLLSHSSHPDDLGKDEVAELALAGRQLLARLVNHKKNHGLSPAIPASMRCDPATPTRSQSHSHSHDEQTTTHSSSFNHKAVQRTVLARCAIADAPQGSSSQGASSASGNTTTAQTGISPCSKPTENSSTIEQPSLGSGRVLSTFLHLAGAIHNLSLANHRGMKTTHDACVEPSKLAPLLQWHWLPLATALLEQTLASETATLSASKPPTAEFLADLASIMSLLELQTLAGTEIMDGCGVLPWKLFYGGSPAGLHLLATLLRYHARAATAAAAATGDELLQPPCHVITSIDVVVSLAAALVRSLDVWGPLHIKRAAGRDAGRATVPAAKQQNIPGPTSYMGPAWYNATWGFAALTVWQAAVELMRAAPPSRDGRSTVWRAMADTALSTAAPCAIQLLLRSAEEVLAAEEDSALEISNAPRVHGRMDVHMTASPINAPSPGGLTRLFQEQGQRSGTGVSKRVVWLHRLDVAREQLCMVRSAMEQPNAPARQAAVHSGGDAGPPPINMCLERCVLLAKSLGPLLPTASASTMSIAAATYQPAGQTSRCTPASPCTPPTPTLKPAPAWVPAPEPWTLPWYAHPSSWAQWEAVLHRLPRDQRGCSYPMCENQDGCAYGQFMSMTTCPCCCLARFCSRECWEQAVLPSAPHNHTCRLLVDEYGGSLTTPGGLQPAAPGF